MSMLAEPRRKQKFINLRAKNNAWSNDSTKFGQRMLERMGWSSGKGLGAKENGIVEHVVAKFKNDERGLGFEDKDDQWTKHEDDFEALLASLSTGSNTGDNKETKLHSGTSLEDKSKKSRARIHYHKFTRGKDLTRYSEKDLANIFGKKSFKKEDKIKKPKEDPQATEQVFTDKGSMEDYFKNKMEAFKCKNQLSCLANQDSLDSRDIEFGFRGFPGPNDKEETEESHLGFGFQSFSLNTSNANDNNVGAEPELNEEEQISSKKSKKKKKAKNKVKETVEEESHPVTDIDFNNAVEELEKDLLNKKIKKAKRKSLQKEPPVPESNELEIEQPVKKKKKKNKEKTLEVPETDAERDTNDVPPKRKKKKNKRFDD